MAVPRFVPARRKSAVLDDCKQSPSRQNSFATPANPTDKEEVEEVSDKSPLDSVPISPETKIARPVIDFDSDRKKAWKEWLDQSAARQKKSESSQDSLSLSIQEPTVRRQISIESSVEKPTVRRQSAFEFPKEVAESRGSEPVLSFAAFAKIVAKFKAHSK